MTISDAFLWNFEDVINFASKIYCPKMSLNDCTDFEMKRIELTCGLMGSD